MMNIARKQDVLQERPRRCTQEDGSSLLVVLVLLMLASLFVLFALNVGRFEQKTSGNDLRAKITQEVAEAGIAQGIEYFNSERQLIADDGYWTLCGAAETAFPCGAVPATRRGSMYTYHEKDSGGTTFANRLVPIPQSINAAGGFAAQQQVGAVLCRVAKPASPTAPTTCATSESEASSTWVLTVVSKGSLPAEGSSSTVTQTIGAYNVFGFNPGLPPVVASGSVSVGGGLQIVTSPNGAGTGVPVSVWTRLKVEKNGTPNTCYMDEFVRQGGSSSGPAHYDGITICHTCQCPGDASLSFPKSGNQACQTMDIVAIDPALALGVAGTNDCPIPPNLNIRREEFPADLFAFLFGQKAWNDVERDGIAATSACTSAALDCHFAEQRRISLCTYPHPATGAPTTATLPEDTCYLLNIKNKIHIGDGINDEAECTALGPSTSGIVWVHPTAILDMPGYDCSAKIKSSTIGTPSKPVALIHDGSLTQVNGMTLYGLLFLREPNDVLVLDKTTGGTANFGINGNANIYGAVVVQGQVTSGGGGSAAIVYNADVLFNLLNDPDNFSPSSLPGSWTDRLRY